MPQLALDVRDKKLLINPSNCDNDLAFFFFAFLGLRHVRVKLSDGPTYLRISYIQTLFTIYLIAKSKK